MLAALLGGVAAALHKTGEAIEEAGQIMGAPQWLTGGLGGAFSALGRGCAGVGEGAGAAQGAVAGIGFGEGIGSRVADFFRGSQEPVQQEVTKCGRSAHFHAHGAPEVANDGHSCNMNDIRLPTLSGVTMPTQQTGFGQGF